MSRNKFGFANKQFTVGAAPTWLIGMFISSMLNLLFVTARHKIFFYGFVTQMLVITYGGDVTRINIAT